MNSAIKGLIIYSVCIGSGCAIVPVPYTGHTGDAKIIDRDTVEFIKIGATTKDDVLLQLGAPDWFNQDSFAYNIVKYRGGWVGFLIVPPTARAGGTMLKFRQSLLINFDENSNVKAYRFIDEGGFRLTN